MSTNPKNPRQEGKPKSQEYAKKQSDAYVPHVSKSGSKGYIKRDHGPAKHHVSYGRHKVDEKLIGQDEINDVIDGIHQEDA
jgi:hypothetical protein